MICVGVCINHYGILVQINASLKKIVFIDCDSHEKFKICLIINWFTLKRNTG